MALLLALTGRVPEINERGSALNFDSIFFLSCFLPVLVGLYWLGKGQRWRNGLLLAAGLVFYAFGSLQGLFLLAAAAAVNFLLGLLIQRGLWPKGVRTVAVAGNLLFLGVYKYLHFLLGSVLGLDVEMTLAAPLGISFFTFKCISYIVDTCREPGKGTRKFSEFLLYVSFFPQVVSGPITRFQDFGPQIDDRRGGIDPAGLRRFVVGLAKKLLLAAPLGAVADTVFGLEAVDARLAWLGAIGYSLQIYFDFSGYSDMAIGLGQLFGFTTAENFRYPYMADSLTNFWRRWHLSLSTWFKDYLYIPLGGNRKGKLRTAGNKIIVFALCGLWHGANWTFLLWGLWHGLFSALESLKLLKPKKLLGRVYTLLVVCLGFVLFRAADPGQGLAVVSAMFTGWTWTPAATVALQSLWNGKTVAVLACAVAACLPWKEWIARREKLALVWDTVSYVLCLGLFLLCVVRLASGGFSPFIYAQF